MAKKNTQSPMFNQIKEWYDTGRWTKERVYNVVGKVITVDEYEEITGEPYE